VRPYEVMVIFDTGTEPSAIQAALDRALETIRAHGGTPGRVDRWGRRPFAYEVRHKREGYYVLVEFGGDPQTVAELDRMLSLADEVLRHRVIRLPDQVAKRSGAAPAATPAVTPGPPARVPAAVPAAPPAEAPPAEAPPAEEPVG